MVTLRKLPKGANCAALAGKIRRRRFLLFRSLAAPLARPYTILDVGGTREFWETVGFTGEDGVSIVLLNITLRTSRHASFRSVVGDARCLGFPDNAFEVVFSNSVIEHVGDFEQQRQMANEVQRVGRRYFLQTPNRFFPFEPHFLFPFFQFLPFRLRVFLIRHFAMGHFGRVRDRRRAEGIVRSIRLLSERELQKLFPDGEIYRERFLGLTKSFVVYGGWDSGQPKAAHRRLTREPLTSVP